VHKRVVLVSGAPGAGKSTLANQLAPVLHLPLLSKDVIKESLWDSFDPPAGSPEWSKRLGAAAMELIWRLAECAPGVVLEANFRPHSSYERSKLLSLNACIVEVYCQCPASVAAERYANRASSPSHHPAHVSPTIDRELLAEFDRPVGVGRLIAVPAITEIPHPRSLKFPTLSR
jgi:predicted kinase